MLEGPNNPLDGCDSSRYDKIVCDLHSKSQNVKKVTIAWEIEHQRHFQQAVKSGTGGEVSTSHSRYPMKIRFLPVPDQ